VGGAHVEIRPSADFIKENNTPQASLEPFGLSPPGPALCSNSNEVFDCWSADFFVIDAILFDSLPFTGRLPPWDEKGNAVRVIAHLNPQLPPQL